MSLTITKGYLINIQDYGSFDEIITFINEYGNRFSCLALGVKKITSKNARSLILGNYNEFEFFQSRYENKISKLKKSTLINQVNWEMLSKNSFNTLNEICYKTNFFSKKVYQYYLENIEFISKNMNDQIALIKILIDYIKISGIKLQTNHCVICGSNKIKTFSLTELGFICSNCFNNKNHYVYSLGLLKLIYFSFNSFEINEIIKYSDYFNQLIIILKNIISEQEGLFLETLLNY